MVMGAPPDNVQKHIESLVRAGVPLIVTVGEPGVQGAAMAGTQGAEPEGFMQAGLAGELHMPKVAMLTIGAKSMIVAAGAPALTIAPSGTTLSTAGTFPIGHMTIAPATTSSDISPSDRHRSLCISR
jgi:hypothetical protein